MSNIKSIKPIGEYQTYDLEVDHPDHQFYLSNGMLTSNSHAIFYSFLGYQTAYLKAHYPLEFLTANLMFEVNSNAPTAADNILKIKSEIRRRNVTILPPDINKSSNTYNIINDKTLVTGFDALKHVGKNAIPEIIEKRPFENFDDFLNKIEGRKVDARTIQALAASGSLDSFGMTRKQMFLYAGDYKAKLQAYKKRKKKNGPFEYPWPEDIGEWTIPEMYAMEHKYIGEGLCCGMRDAYPGFFDSKAIDFSTLAEKFPDSGDPKDKYEITGYDGTIEGVIKSYFEFKVKKENSKIFGRVMAKVDIECPQGNTMSMTIFPDGLDLFNDRLNDLTGGKVKLEPGIAVYCTGSLNWYEGTLAIIFNNLMRVAPIPPEPKDLKPKKVSMRKVKTKTQRKPSDVKSPHDFLDQVEDELIDEGHSDAIYDI